MRVRNGKCIRNLSAKSMKAAKSRNTIAIIAIALTTILFTTLFSIAMSINDSFQQSNFRQAGGFSHGTFKYLTEEQIEALSADSLIQEYGLRRFVGMPEDAPFHKSQVEVSYCDANAAKWMYVVPEAGRMPQEGTNEAATDTRVLSLLGIEPVLGAEFSITFTVDGEETTESFTLCGWWTHDEAAMASHVLIPSSYAQAIFDTLGTKGFDGMAGSWNMDVMFSNAMGIEEAIQAVLEHHGCQNETRGEANYIATGVNWGYTGAQMSNNLDMGTILMVAVLLLIIMFTGYLVIYNVFLISVAGDIRHYGLLKTIGTTGRQIKRIIRIQAFRLSAVGIPAGLLLGYGLGVLLAPRIFTLLNGVYMADSSASPQIFIVSALFSLLTVLISCRKPGRIAAKVSPIEAVRYTEAEGSKGKMRKGVHGASLPKMALANLGRSRKKTVLTTISLSLAVVLLNITVTFTNGFDMDKYLENMVADYIVADAGYFSVSHRGQGNALSEEAIAEISQQDGITSAGRVYGMTSYAEEFVTEEYFRGAWWSEYYDGETLDALVEMANRSADGRLALDVQLYGMEDYALSKLTVYDGDLSKLNDPSGRYAAAVYHEDDYGNFMAGTNWAEVGDRLTVRYIDEF